MIKSRRICIYATERLLAAAFIASIATLAPAQQGTTMVSIESMDIGSTPADFDFARTGQGGPGVWKVVADPSAGGGRAIEQTSTERTDYLFPMAVYRSVAAANIEVSVRFKAVGGSVDQAAGVAVRVADADNYYVVRANALEDNVRFYRVVNGRREQIAGVNLKVAPSIWHTLALRAEGSRFIVTFNGQELYTANDQSLTAAGKIALWTKADSVTRFDQMRINVLP